MRKVIFQIIMIIMLFIFVACGNDEGVETVYLDTAEYMPYAYSEYIPHQEISPIAEDITVEKEIEEILFENGDDTILPHPFATALKNFMADYDGSVRAYLATLDDDGTVGVLVRPTTKVAIFDDWYDEYIYVYRHLGTMFYMQGDEMLYIDTPGFVAGRYNRVMTHHQAHTHIVEFIWKLVDGAWETSTRLAYFSDGYLFYLNNGCDSGFFDERNITAERIAGCDITVAEIAQRDANAEYAREKYGLVALPPPNFGHMHNTEDNTAEILALTINCVPVFPRNPN